MTQPAAATDSPLFTQVEAEQFEADDVEAGAAIGKMLSILFLYTVLAMSFVAWWTVSSNAERDSRAVSTESAAH